MAPLGKSFLVFSGGNDRAVLGFMRALRLCGQRASIVARTDADRILRTSFRSDVCWIRPDHQLSLDVFAEGVRQARRNRGNAPLVVLPSTEYFNTFLLRHRQAIEAMGCEVPLVGAALYARLTDKRTSVDFFADAGVDVPRELDPALGASEPLVAKPRSNVSPSGASLYPVLLDTRGALAGFLQQHDPSHYFFQEHVSGDSVYLLFHLSHDATADVTWSQRNLLQQPGGKSMLLAEGSDFHLSHTAARIVPALHAAGFHGLGMVEIIRSGNRDVFIEMNPRIWGPVQFCVDQHQPILQAFIGQALMGDPRRYVARHPVSVRRRYFWLGGLMDTCAAGGLPTWHATPRNLSRVMLGNITRDVYLRRDSWRCFLHDLTHALRARKSS